MTHQREDINSKGRVNRITETDTRNIELYKCVPSQLAAEQSRCFNLEVEVAELRQKLKTMETLEKELELLHR